MFACFLEHVVHCGRFQALPPREAIMLGQNWCQEGQEARPAGQEGLKGPLLSVAGNLSASARLTKTANLLMGSMNEKVRLRSHTQTIRAELGQWLPLTKSGPLHLFRTFYGPSTPA